MYVFATHGIMYNGQSYIVIDADEKNLKYWKDLIRHDIVRVHGMLMVNKEAQQNRTRTVSPAAIPSKANYRVKSKKHL